MSFRHEIRQATQTAHEALDQYVDGLGLLDSGDGFQRFLETQALAHRGMEARFAALPAALRAQVACATGPLSPNPPRSRLAAVDAGWSEAILERRIAETPPPPDIATPAALWGAFYVVEGSALGARVIRKRLLERGVVLDGRDRFLGSADRDGAARWRAVATGLDARAWSADDKADAIGAAEACFSWFRRLFETGARATPPDFANASEP